MSALEVYMQRITTATFTGAGTNYLIETPSGVLYFVFSDVNQDVAFIKSVDRGRHWSAPTVLLSGSCVNLSVWYDRWSGIDAGLIHCAYTETSLDDTRYRSIDTENADALSTETTIFAGGTTASGGHLSITRARGGNLYCKTVIDAGAEGGFFRSTDVGATWSSRTVDETIATQDQMILLPGFAADNQDIIGIFWDASANEVSRKLYDDSANSWAESSIATSMVDSVATSGFPHFAAAVDLENSRIVLVAWNAIATANADLRCWTITESAITEVTNVILNSGGNQGLAAISIDLQTGDWHVFYAGNSSGTEVFSIDVGIYKKVSTDDGSTWGAEAAVLDSYAQRAMLFSNPRAYSSARICSTSTTSVAAFALPSFTARTSPQLGI